VGGSGYQNISYTSSATHIHTAWHSDNLELTKKPHRSISECLARESFAQLEMITQTLEQLSNFRVDSHCIEGSARVLLLIEAEINHIAEFLWAPANKKVWNKTPLSG